MDSWKLRRKVVHKRDERTYYIKAVYNVHTDDFTKSTERAYVRCWKSSEGSTYCVQRFTGHDGAHNFTERGEMLWFGDLFFKTMLAL